MKATTSLLQRVVDVVNDVHTAFGAPGDFGYETLKGRALYALYQARNAVAALTDEPDGTDAPLEDRLANCLAECVDTTLLTVRDTMNDRPVELRLGSFNREVSERAAELLEECGR